MSGRGRGSLVPNGPLRLPRSLPRVLEVQRLNTQIPHLERRLARLQPRRTAGR